MSFLGKVLIVTQVVLSVLFMCAAGAVFALHTDWRASALTSQAALEKARTDHNNAVQAFNSQIDTLTLQAQTEKNRADAEVGARQRLEAQVATLTQETNTLNQQVQRQTGLAETKSNEAEFRQQEAEQQRVQNELQRAALDVLIQENGDLTDRLRGKDLEYEELVVQHDTLLERLGLLEKIVRQNNLSVDPASVAGTADPPPPVEGIVVATRKDKTNRTSSVQISIGSDDGIQVGHELDVYRSAERNNGQARYLGRIRIVYVTPDEAVGTVVEAAKNGIIERGDNATTKL